MAPTETLAEQHFATLADAACPASSCRPRCSPARRPAARRADLLGKLADRRAATARRHPRADRGAGRVRPPRRRGGRRAAPLRRPPAPRARPQGAGRARAARPAHDRDADPAHARADRLRRPRHDRRCASCRPGGSRSRRTSCVDRARARRAPTSASARSCATGRQAFVVCPLVEESEALQARAATPRPSGCAPASCATSAVVLLHGQMRPREKQEAMAAFAARRGRRAGGDDRDRGRDRRAERDGDAGRGRRALRHLPAAPAARAGRARRARVAVPAVRRRSESRAAAGARASTRDGFELAEIDLELRGEGEILGTRQPGLPRSRSPRLPEDAELLERAAHARAARLARRRPRARARPSTRCCARGAAAPRRSSPSPHEDRSAGALRRPAPARAARAAARRPTSDRVREALFSILGERVDGARVLDLFAGSGALGHRGALARRRARPRSSTARRPRSAPSSDNLEALGGAGRGAPRATPCGSSTAQPRAGAPLRSRLPRPAI